jgi:iron(III) transport system permease protein
LNDYRLERRNLLSGRRFLAAGALGLAAYLLIPPLLFTLHLAFRSPPDLLPNEQGGSWSLENFTNIYTNGTLQNTLTDTSVFVLGSVALAVIIGCILAWLVERTDLPGRRAVFILVLFPMMMPNIITTMGWLLLLGERMGALNVLIRTILPIWESGPFNVFSMYGMIIVQGSSLISLPFLFSSAGLRNMDATLEEASHTSGVNRLTTLRRITLPLLSPHILGGALLVAIFTIESFEVPLLLGGGASANIFSTRLYYELNSASGALPAYGNVAAIGLHFLALTYLLFLFYQIVSLKAERHITLTGRGTRGQHAKLGKWKWPITACVGALLIIISIAPFLVLIWTSLLPHYLHPSMGALSQISFDQYRDLLADKRLIPVWGNTITIAIVAPTVSVGTAFILAWIIARSPIGRGWKVGLDLFLSSSVAIPSVVAANSFLVFYLLINQSIPAWFPLYGTIVVLILVYAHRLGVVYRMSRAGIAQLSKELEDASMVSGVSPIKTLRKIVLPLAGPSLIGAWIILYLVAFKEFTLPMIVGRESPPFVISVFIWKLWHQHTGQAAALGVLTVGFLSMTVFALRSLTLKRWN